MKIKCNTQKLSEASANVQRAVSSKTSIAALEGILLTADYETISLCGYDLEIGITTTLDALVAENGSVVLNARLFCEILRKLPSESVEISTDDKLIVTIKSGETEYSLVGISSEEYPEIPDVNDSKGVVLPQNLLKNMIRQTIFSVATVTGKPVHKGVRFEIKNDSLRLVAVDGFRLAIRNEKLAGTGTEAVFVVPSKTLSEVTKLLLEDDTELSIGIGKKHIIFEINNYSVISRLYESDEFMDYESAIPQTHTVTVRVNTRMLIDSLDRLSLLISTTVMNPVRCTFGDGIIKMTCATALGTCHDSVHAIIEGEPVEIGFRSKFVLDALHAIDSDEVLMEMGGPLNPIKNSAARGR